MPDRPARAILVLTTLALIGAGGATRATTTPDTPAEIVILPQDVMLTGAGSRQQLVVAAKAGAALAGDRTAESAFSSSDPRVATVDAEGVVTAVGDGRATITARAGERAATTVVDVKGASAPPPLTFRNHVVPVLTKAGCNSGPCHGALAGKNGFKLTLRGYDPEADYYALTRQASARRVNTVQPAASLMLLKPTLAIAHGGGRRFTTRSPEYRVIADWIAEGAPAPVGSDPAMTRLEILPAALRLAPGDEGRFVVRAHFSDGRAEDVTRWARFSSGDASVAAVDGRGRVKVQAPGEAPISAWYLSRIVTARVTAPFPGEVDAQVFARAPRVNFIDDLVLQRLAELNIEPSQLSSDTEFIRRAFLDAAGILPAPEEVRAFLADPAPDKREALVDRLLAREEFVDYWAYKWSDLLLVSSKSLPTNAMWAYYRWIRANVAANTPWDRMARELLTASGNTLANGAANYYVLHKNPVAITENVAMTFMGFSITCARCHNHPLERWTQKDYYGMANLFSRVAIKNGTERGDLSVFTARSGDIPHPRTNAPLPPKPLDGPAVPLDASVDRRAVFADWLVAPDNPFFAKTLVNRVWKNFMGRGLVEAVDDIRDANPPSNAALMDALTREFVASGFDVKRLVRTVMMSSTYQLTSKGTPGNVNDLTHHSHYIARRLPAEVILDAISQVTGVPEEFPGHPGRRALQLPDAAVDSYFLTAFGRPPRITAAHSERQQEPSITQALHVINGDTINRKLAAPSSIVSRLLAAGADDRTAVETLYLAALSRLPDPGEIERLSSAMRQGADAAAGTEARRRALEDLAWAVLTSREFLFTH